MSELFLMFVENDEGEIVISRREFLTEDEARSYAHTLDLSRRYAIPRVDSGDTIETVVERLNDSIRVLGRDKR